MYKFLIVFLSTFSLLIWCSADKGQPETVEHGPGRSYHESFEDKHYKDGKHDAHKDHEAVLGSKKVAEEFDQLPAEESKRRLRKLAQKMDKNQDGYVDEDELYQWIHDNMKKLDVEEAFDEADVNKDGVVLWDEYVNETFGTDKLDPEDQKMLEEDSMYFKVADLNRDGKLDKIEYASFQNPEHHEHMHESVIESTLKDKDLDKDGHISVDEFLAEYTDRKDTDWYNSEKARFSEQYDANKDGKLNRDEIKTWLIPDVQDASRQETRHLFEQADKNRDGLLSIDEVADAHNVFAGSEATDFGEHLLRHTEF